MKKRFLLIGILALVIIAGAVFLWKISRPAAVRKKPPSVKAARPAPRYGLPAAGLKMVLPAAKRFANPRVAVVIDDFGYSMNNVKIFLDINKPLTFSILPNLRYSSKIAMLASEKGNDVILHLPLEPHRKGSSADLAAINSGMSNAEVLSRLDSAIKNIPDIKGVSNHEGSLATEDPRLMEVIIREIGAKGLFFLDSATSQRSICQGVAKTAGTRFAKRDIFLDNNPSVGAVKKEMETLTRLAFRKGRAVAICHDRKNTASALSEMMPKMAAEGVEFVPVSEFAK